MLKGSAINALSSDPDELANELQAPAGPSAGPWGLTFIPFLMAHQGRPYDIDTSNDLTGDNFFNNRPAYADASNCPSTSPNYAATWFGCLDVAPGAGSSVIPANRGMARRRSL